MRWALWALLRLFPDRVDGILRSEMEETFLDGLRASPTPVRFAVRELWSLVRNGAGERVEGLHPMSIFSTLRDDFRLALRKLSKNIAFSVTAVLTLTVGIAATVAMFSILEVALLRSQPFPEPDELVLGRATFSGQMNMTCSFPDYLSHKEESDAFEAMAAVLPNLQRWSHGSTAPGGERLDRPAGRCRRLPSGRSLTKSGPRGRSSGPARCDRGRTQRSHASVCAVGLDVNGPAVRHRTRSRRVAGGAG